MRRCRSEMWGREEICKERLPLPGGRGLWGWEREPFAKWAPDVRARPPGGVNLVHLSTLRYLILIKYV